ncbi:MAG: integrase [Mesorhizobium sp.]|uniref:tyrosine-type recombinase/integrase n=1 Tax=unclassified Mesorhizobium TaxID=325217 RepID=UPI000F7597EA|nr:MULTISPECIES: tyrosine-type recombinase/integrase [unclassified Mesorhizobium]AZO50286.1 integrase [Mesorhizobium sp. M4B.F.Ca.ET.058.02.1.1]RWD32125.1 MAG: integrase [Mesorhizobium sp.]TIW12276.1 MAG: integrase [Mesorhizobium sp.]TIW36687.1 MAG: integrase [Mesorhizobium sp.]
MSRLRTALERYVGMRQGLGYKYHGPARRLSDFVTFMEACGAETVTTALAMKWVTLIGRQPSWSIRLTDVRCFAQHLAHFDPLTEVPPQDAVSPARRAKPYIYTDAEITALLAAALSLPPANALRRWTYHCLFGFIAVAGLRHSEALDLLRDDVDLDQGILTIRETKFGKSRLVPLHATTVAVLSDYAARRDAHLVAPRSPYFFVAEQGGRLLHQYVHRVCWQLSRQIGLRQRGQRNGPRIHDLRHRFAVHALTNWYRAGEDVERELPVLSTFLGHANVRDTYWYLSAAPELMTHAARLLDKRWEVHS